jgi:uncharacterized phage-associated protein
MTSANAVARYLIDRGEGRVSPTQLHHLLYFVQGYALVLLKRPAFADEIVAGPSGPVVPTLVAGTTGHDLPPILTALLDMVWGRYGKLSQAELERLVPAERANAVISSDAMIERFREQVADDLKVYPFPVPDPADDWLAEEERLTGPTRDSRLALAELKRRLATPTAP